MSSRPYYETPSQREAEDAFGRDISKRFGKDLRRWGDRYAPVDFKVYDPDNILIGMAEVKCRTVSREFHRTLMIGTKKIDKGRALAKSLGVPFTLFVRWTNADGFFRPRENEQLHAAPGGRTVQTRDKWDPELCYYIHLCRFILF